MKLIGMLDSPFVRRTAIGLNLLGLPFEHQSLSVFRDYEKFQQINPLVKAPTLVLDSGETLVDSTLILNYAERASGETLYPTQLNAYEHATRLTGLALIACEKSVQIYYENNLRPTDKQHEPWLNRVTEQLSRTYAEIETAVETNPNLFNASKLSHANIAIAIAWLFTKNICPDAVEFNRCPHVNAWSKQAENIDVFKRYPFPI